MNRKFVSKSNRVLRKVLNSKENLDILQDFIETFLKIKIQEIELNPYLESKSNNLPSPENFGIADVRVKLQNQEELNVGIQFIDGKFAQMQGTLEDYLHKDERNNRSKVVNKDKKNAKFAKLDYEVLKYNEVKDLSLLKINLHTGRHHQIRVQLANFGHSIFGDQKYGTRGKGKQIALWAYQLTIVHPITKEEMVFEDLPEPVGTWCILNNKP